MMKEFRDSISNIKYNLKLFLIHRTAILYGIFKENRRYNASFNPFRLISLNPDIITLNLKNSNYYYKKIHENVCRGSHIQGWDWDIETQRIIDTDYYRSFIDHFIEKVPWEETEIYKKTERIIRNGGRYWHHCDSMKKLKQRCEYLDSLYLDIAGNGYRTKWQLMKKKKFSTLFGSKIFEQPEFHEIVVGIGRRGHYILLEGKHRLAIAHLLRLKSVPVCIMVRHSQWQSIRDRIYCEENPGEYESHPDIRSLLAPG